jgi:hypothetical protein
MNTQQIIKRRHVTLIIVRCVALTMMTIGSIYVTWGLGSFFAFGGLSAFFDQFAVFWDGNWNPFWFGFGIFVPGLLLALMSRTITRWLIPLQRHECPQCGYALKQLGSNRCPECGCEIEPKKEMQ